MKRILILNGAGNKRGNTARLIESFRSGLDEIHEVCEIYLQDLDIRGCVDCQGCGRKAPGTVNPCIHRDDMHIVYEEFTRSDVIVFASPVYWWTISGTLKTAVDRLYALVRNSGNAANVKQSVLLMVAGGNDFRQPLMWYQGFEYLMGWENLGVALNNMNEAVRIAKSIRSVRP